MRVCRAFVFFPILFVFSCSGENNTNVSDTSDKIRTLSGKQQRDTVFLNFVIPEKTILAQRTGKLERLVENPEFKKNSLLVQFDNYDSFVELSGEKEALKSDLTDLLNNLPKSLQPIEKKWRDFAAKLTPDKIMPAFPVFEYKEEAGFFEEAKIREKYDAIQKKEAAVQNYFQLSPEDGFITQTYAHTDEYVKKNKPLITYHPKKIKVMAEAAFPLSKSITKQIKNDLLIRIPVGQIRVILKTPTTIRYSLTLNQKLDPKICPKYVIINQDQNVFRVPKDFVGRDKKVSVSGEKEKLQAYYKNGQYVIYSDKPSLKIQKI
ncbi:hypothetical protein [Fluviicola sp.]|uniref:hypothetical protein n=1 Tax=Fluviicola sp. TaxID=1917219 RepID=UPI0031CDE3EB